MTKHRVLLWTLIGVLVAGCAVPVQAADAAPAASPTTGREAGKISALLPVAVIERGVGRRKTSTEAKKGEELIWNDLLKTQRGGRARVTLVDGSILSLGSQSELKIVRHEARTQQTALQLSYGRIRAEVASITRAGGRFSMRTPTAVAGVIGTDFGSDASTVGSTTFLCISGSVQVSNIDPKIAGSVDCAPGLTTTVALGKPPTPPTNATPDQIQQLILDTEPAIISAMSPTAALPGATVDTNITGTKMAGITGVAVSGAGVQATLAPGGTETSVTVHLAIGADAAPGPRTITLTKPSGAASAALFTIMAPPTAEAGGDPKKPYHDIFETERVSARAGLGAVLLGVKQAVDQAQQQLTGANQPGLDLTQATTSLNAQTTAVQNAIDQAGKQVDEAVAGAVSAFDAGYTTAHNALLERDPAGTPDDTFNQALQALFTEVNGNLGNNFKTISGNLNTAAQTASANVQQILQDWLARIKAAAGTVLQGPTPAVNLAESSVDVGAALGAGSIAALDASRSKAPSGASIAGYSWVLCDPSYKPAQFGVPIPPTTPGCNPVSGYASTSADFAFPTCNLAPGDYVARVTITDSAGKKTAMDVKVHVLAGTYDDPPTVVRNLAAAYMSLQSTKFMSYFDENNYPGYTVLSENIRQTFPQLASMNINLRISQSSISCNDATVRADWQQNFSFKQVCTTTALTTGATVTSCTNPNVTLTQTEQLSVRMIRAPGKGWQIVDFQGDSGTVPPGPVITETAAPDLTISGLSVPSAAVGAGGALTIIPGSTTVVANVSNIGTQDLTQEAIVRFELRNASNAVVASADSHIEVPFARNGSQQFVANLTVPSVATGTRLTLVATVNPTCASDAPQELTCSNNQTSLALTVGAPAANYIISSVTFTGHTAPYVGGNGFQVGETLTASAVVTNIGNLTQNGNITVTLGCTPVPPCDAVSNLSTVVPAPAAGASVVASGPVTFDLPTGSYSGSAALTTALPQSSTADDTASIPFEVVDFALSLVSPLSPAQNIRVPLSGQSSSSGQIQVSLTETGASVPFSIPLTTTLSPADATVSLSPTTFQSPGTFNAVVTPSLSTTTGTPTVTITGTNHGVTKSVSQVVDFYTAQLRPTSLFLNDPSAPLGIPRGDLTGATVNMTLSGTAFSGSATLVPPVSSVGFTSTLLPTSVSLGGTTDWNITASSTATSVVTPLVLTAQMPNSFPTDTLSFTLYVAAASVPDLQVVSATPTPAPTPAVPLLAGQPFDYSVTVANNSPVPSAGGEAVTVKMNGYVIGTTTAPALAPGGSTTVSVHCITPDFNLPTSSSVSIRINPDTTGDLNYADNTLSGITLNTSDWGLAIFTGSQGTSTNPLLVQAFPSLVSGTATITTFAVSGGFGTTTVSLVPGQYSNFLAAPLIASLGPPTADVTVGASSTTAASGTYLVQIIGQMKDGATVTAQRQVTIVVQVTGSTASDTVTLTSSRNNIAPAPATPAATVQINGALTEQLALTASRSGCAPASPCPGSVDLSVTDATNTDSTPQQMKAVAYNFPQVLQVKAFQDASGQVQTGTASGYSVSATSVQTSQSQTSASPVGQVFNVAFSVSDIEVTGAFCTGVVAGGTPPSLSAAWAPSAGFGTGISGNLVTWEWEDANYAPVSTSPVTFSTASGTSTCSAGSCSALPSFTLTNTSPQDGVQLYFLAATISNSVSTATKYFPFYFDLSTAQNFCGAVGNVRPPGSWRQGAVPPALGVVRSLAPTIRPLGSSGTPDLRLIASDVSYTPSIPKAGDLVQVRFRVSNAGDGNAVGVPIALQVNGVTVASDRFDVAAGRTTLAGLQWNSSQMPAAALPRSNVPVRKTIPKRMLDLRYDTNQAAPDAPAVFNAALVIDPQHTTQQKTTLEKSAALPRFRLLDAGSGGAGGAPMQGQRVLVEADEGACIGLRLVAGTASPCAVGSADLELTIQDLAKGTYTMNALNGVADLGASFGPGQAAGTGPQGTHFSSQAAAEAGHRYAVRLSDGGIGYVTIQSLRNPAQLDAQTRALFRRQAVRIMSGVLGVDSSGPSAPGELTGVGSRATVFIELLVQVP